MDSKTVARALRDVLSQIDGDTLEATAIERAYVAGSLYALEQLDEDEPI